MKVISYVENDKTPLKLSKLPTHYNLRTFIFLLQNYHSLQNGRMIRAQIDEAMAYSCLGYLSEKKCLRLMCEMQESNLGEGFEECI
jgi:hypothetical protein